MSFYEKLGLKRIINAAGKLTALGGSAVSPEVAKAMFEAAQAHVELEALLVKSGEYIAKLLGAEGAVVTTGAAAGVCIATAAAVAGKDYAKIKNLPLSTAKNQIVIMKGHCVNFGAPILSMIRLGGGVPLEVGQTNSCTVDDIRASFNENTAAFMYVKSHHAVQKGVVSLEDCVKTAHELGIPILVDAAAEDDIWVYPKMGIDLTTYSGSKAILGPTAGLIVGKKELVDACRMQYRGIARPMKVGKEGIIGMMVAVEAYGGVTSEHVTELREKAEYMALELRGIPGVEVAVVQDEAGRVIFRTEVKIDEEIAGLSAMQVANMLSSGDPAIFTRNHYANVGIILVDPRPLAEGEEKIVAARLKAILTGRE